MAYLDFLKVEVNVTSKVISPPIQPASRCAVFLALVVLLASCASRAPLDGPKPVVKSIAIVPATTPSSYTLDNRNGALGLIVPGIAAIGYAVENKKKAQVFNEKLLPMQLNPGLDFTEGMAAALRSQGYSVQILDNVFRDPADPDNVEYEKVSHSADALLHIYFSEIGLYSPPWSVNYLPRVNGAGNVFVKGRRDYLYEGVLYFGADAREGKAWAIMSDEKYAYPDFEGVLANLDSVRHAYGTGVREIIKRMSEQIHAALK